MTRPSSLEQEISFGGSYKFSTFSAVHNSELPSQTREVGNGRFANVKFVLQYILAVLKTVDTKDSSGRAESMVSQFLGNENAQLFLHELNAFLRSPYMDLESWDHHVQYQKPQSISIARPP